MIKKSSGIYKITNPKGRIYIGQAVNFYNREIHYRKLHCKKQCKIYNSILKYGFENHIFEIIEECSREYLNERESYWISFYDSYNNGMNLTSGGDACERSKETNKKISESKKGDKNWMYGRTKELHPNFGKKASIETIEKLRSSHIGQRMGKNNNMYKGDVYVYKDGTLIGSYESAKEAGLALNVQSTNIEKVIKGKRSHTGGCVFTREKPSEEILEDWANRNILELKAVLNSREEFEKFITFN